MDKINAILDNIFTTGCSDNDVYVLLDVFKKLTNFSYIPTDEDLATLKKILDIPMFSDAVHELFDVVLSGLVMYENSALLWAKWIHNRMLMTSMDDNKALFYQDPTQYIQTHDDIGVRALYMLKDIFVPQYMETDEHVVDCRYSNYKAITWLNETFDEWRYSKLLYRWSVIPIFSQVPAYYLTYQDCNNGLLMKEHAKLYSNMLKLVYDKDTLELASPVVESKQRRLKVGFVSRFLSNHSVGKISAGLIEGLAKSNFDVYVYTLDNTHEVIGQHISNVCSKYVNPKGPLGNWIESIRSDALDTLVILDPIMDINMYLLGCFRLAPIQVSTWGHPDTSGLPYIDYYISSSLFEKYNDSYYTEQLIRFKSMGICYKHIDDFIGFNTFDLIKTLDKQSMRHIFRLPVDVHIYGITSNMIKINPQMDRVIDAVLEADKHGVVVMIMWKDMRLFDRVCDRLRRNVKNFDRIIFLQHQTDMLSFLKLVYTFDVVLDTHPFGGCISSLETFIVGVCIVTLPGNKLYGRFTQGFYKVMGVEGLVAKDMDEYVKIAVRVASNQSYRVMLENQIIVNNHKLFGDQESVKEWAEFLNTVNKNLVYS
jgi:predicted O-linked N-acetylglucosamine transferase (SPINDLY family)